MGQPKVLVVGAGIAGPAAAYWLVKAGCEVTLVERAPEIRKNGQSIDVRNDGVKVIKLMGIEKAIRAKTTSEAGIQFVNDNGKVIGQLGASGDERQQSFTSEFEIFRGDLAMIMYDVTKDKVKYIFGDYVKSLTQNEHEKNVTAEFHNGTPTQTFDLVVGADGLKSKTRAMAFKTDAREHLKPLNLYVAYWTIEKDLLKGSKYCQVQSVPGGRQVALRPDPDPRGRVRANFGICGKMNGPNVCTPFLEAEGQPDGTERIKKLFADGMKDRGWLCNEMIESMMESTDFYSSEVAQVYAPSLYQGRIALVGDAACCPSPVTGSGTTLSYTTSYLLAGEINNSVKKGEDLAEALKRYDDIMLPRARKTQKLFPGGPGAVNPQTRWGITVQRCIIWFMTKTGLFRLIVKLSGLTAFGEGLGLPDYEWIA